MFVKQLYLEMQETSHIVLYDNQKMPYLSHILSNIKIMLV